jgi:hypothetical protein
MGRVHHPDTFLLLVRQLEKPWHIRDDGFDILLRDRVVLEVVEPDVGKGVTQLCEESRFGGRIRGKGEVENRDAREVGRHAGAVDPLLKR